MKGKNIVNLFLATLTIVCFTLAFSCGGKGKEEKGSKPDAQGKTQTDVWEKINAQKGEPSQSASESGTAEESQETGSVETQEKGGSAGPDSMQMKQAAEGIVAFGKAMEEASKEMQNLPQAVTPVHFKELLKFLPESAGGDLKAQKPFGESQNMGGFSSSEVRREFTSDEGKRLKVEIMDTGFAPFLVSPFFMMAKSMNRETTEEYEKGTEVEGFPAYEKFHYENKDGELSIMVGKRFMVKIEGNGFDDAEPIKALAGKIDLKGLEKLAVEKTAKK